LTEWLKIMLGEIARKQDDASRAAAERKLRQQDSAVPSAALPPSAGKSS
jgi:hypothetical protein